MADYPVRYLRTTRRWVAYPPGENVLCAIEYRPRLQRYDGIIVPLDAWPFARRNMMTRKARFDTIFDAACFALSPHTRKNVYG